jgi:hypothetical protein
MIARAFWNPRRQCSFPGNGHQHREVAMRAVLILSTLVALILLAAPPAASAQAPQEPQKLYCLEGQGGVRNCIYESLERCEQMVSVRTIGGRCVINPALAGTTGSSAAGGLNAPRGSGQHSLDRLPAPVR